MPINIDKLLEEAKASIEEKAKTEAVAEAEVLVERETVIPDDFPEKSLCGCADCPLRGSTAVLGEGTKDIITPVTSKRYLKRYGFEAQAYSERLDRDYSATYDIVLCAISPVELEMSLGRPMVGWSGQIIRETLKKMGVKKYYLTNALLCNYPEGMTESKIALAGKCCRERLLTEIKRVKVKLVVVLGKVPLEAIMGFSQKITSVEGQILPFGDFSLLPITHPASLSRTPSDFRDFVDYLRNAPKFLKGTYQTAKVPTTVVVNEDNYGEVLRDIEAHELVSLDLETTKNGLFPYGRDPDKIRCVVVGVSDSKSYIIPGYSSPYYDEHPNFIKDPRLKEVLGKCRLITHNGPFDIGFLKQEGFDNVKMYFDTFLAHYMLDEREFSHGLKVIGPKYTGAPNWEKDIKNYLPHKNSSYDLIPDEALYTYATWDGSQTYQLATGVDFIHKVPKVFWDLIMPCANMFTDIRHKGFPIDMDLLLSMNETLEIEYQNSVAELIDLVGHVVDPQSAQEMISLLYDELGFQVLPRYGRTSSKKILPLLGGPICESILECREVAKFKGTYVAGISSYMDWDCRIHPLTKIHGAVTGRISTENPSVMNITKRRGIKKLYLPEEGHLILEADQGQMEFRCYAVLADDAYMKKLFLDGRDPHMEVAHALAIQRKLPWDTMDDKARRELRQRCKSGDFGRLYGRGLDSFIHGYGLDETGAKAFVAVIDSVFPSIKDYNRQIKKEIHTQGFLESYFERRRRFGLLLDEIENEAYRQGANFKVQSMASDVNLFLMLELWNRRKEFGVTPMFPVHDSIVMDIPNESVIPGIRKLLLDKASDLVEKKMVFDVEINYGKSWGETVKWKP